MLAGPNTSPKENYALAIVLVASALWLSWLGWLNFHHPLPTSPDEAANHVLAQAFADHGTYTLPTTLNASQLNHFHPRSLTVQGSTLLPGSFVGFITIVGLSLKLGQAGPQVVLGIVWLVALWCWYRIGRRFWEWPWALASTVLVASIPVLIAHQVLPFTQPAWYVAFLIMTGWALLRYQERPVLVNAIVLGLLYGLALFVRPVEVLFTGPIIAVVMIAKRRWWLLLTILVTIVVQWPWLSASRHLFGSAVGSGYGTVDLVPKPNTAQLSIFRVLFVPASGHWSWYWLTAARDYLLLLYPAMSALSVMAIIVYFRRKFIEPMKILKVGLVVLFIAYYLAYYGSWNLYPDVAASRIGSAASYARYWLPLYVAMAAGSIVFLRRAIKRFSLAGWLLAGLMVINFFTWWSHPSGYRAVLADQRQQESIERMIVASTSDQGLVIAGQYDKLLVGRRLTSFSYPQDDDQWQVVQAMAQQRPVYILALDMPFRPSAYVQNAAAHRITLQTVTTIYGQPLWQVKTI